MATTTLAAIIDNMATDIAAISTSPMSNVKFTRSPKRFRLREWAESAGSKAFRTFEISPTGGADRPELHPPGFVERGTEQLTLTVAYPVLPAFYRSGSVPDDVVDQWEVMRNDARAIYSVLRDATNYLIPAQIDCDPTIEPPDTSDDSVWFQELICTVKYYEAT